jgi:hypothetical protein
VKSNSITRESYKPVYSSDDLSLVIFSKLDTKDGCVSVDNANTSTNGICLLNSCETIIQVELNFHGSDGYRANGIYRCPAGGSRRYVAWPHIPCYVAVGNESKPDFSGADAEFYLNTEKFPHGDVVGFGIRNQDFSRYAYTEVEYFLQGIKFTTEMVVAPRKLAIVEWQYPGETITGLRVLRAAFDPELG